MKAALTFDLPEETADLQGAIAAYAAWSTLDTISNEIRQHEKHDVPIEKVLENIKLHICDALQVRGGV